MSNMLKQAIALLPTLQAVMATVLARSIQREDVVKATFLALISKRPAFLLGPPGVNKTGTIEQIARYVEGAQFFEALMPTIVSPEQLLVESTSIEETTLPGGGKSIRTRDELGRAADAHLVFADEIWKAEPRVLQTLLDLSKGDGVRHEGQMVKTPMMAFLAASNELPDPEGNLGALWSRMTIRVDVKPLDRAGKLALVKARLDMAKSAGGASTTLPRITLEDLEVLRAARPHVAIPNEITELVLEIYQGLIDDDPEGFEWLWADDRRFGRVFDVLQAHALLHGRTVIGKEDLAVLEWLLWDSPEQIAVVKAKIAPYCRTLLMDGQELVDALMVPGGTVQIVLVGDRSKGVQALTQCEETCKELKALEARAEGAMKSQIAGLLAEVEKIKVDVIAVVTGMRR